METSLGEDVIVHANWAEHRLIMIDLGENVQVHVDYVKNVVWSWRFSEMMASSTLFEHNIVWLLLTLEKTSSATWTTRRTSPGHDWPWRRRHRGSRRWEHIVSGQVIDYVLPVNHAENIVWSLLTYILKEATASTGVCFKSYYDGFYLSLDIPFHHL